MDKFNNQIKYSWPLTLPKKQTKDREPSTLGECKQSHLPRGASHDNVFVDSACRLIPPQSLFNVANIVHRNDGTMFP